jgi:hypothetical protein
MKRFLLCVSCIIFYAILPVAAQNQLDIGLVGGLNISDAIIEDNAGDDPKASSVNEYGIGIQAELQIHKNIALGTNILYLRKGLIAETSDPLTFDIWAGYIEVPLYIKYSFGTTIRPYFMAGPSLGLLLNSEVDVPFGGLNFNGDFKPVLRNSELSVLFAAGVTVPVWIGQAFIQGRYLYGLQDLIKGGTVLLKAGETLRQEATIDSGDNLYTRCYQIFAGFSVQL